MALYDELIATSYTGESASAKYQGCCKELQIIAGHDIERILDQWEALYEHLANEFTGAKVRNKFTAAHL